MNILVILGHPARKSLCKEIAKTYEKEASKYNIVRKLYLGELKFNPNLKEGYNKKQPLEKDLKKAQKLILWANHIVIIYPTWWGGMPAILKGFIDRVFLPGFAFKYKKNSPLPEKFLKDKTGEIITTTGGPKIYYKIMGHPGNREIRKWLFNFCGIEHKKTTIFSSINKDISKEKIQKILEKTKKLAQKNKCLFCEIVEKSS